MEIRKNKKGETVYREMIIIDGKAYKSKFSNRITDAKAWKIRMQNEKNKFEFQGIPFKSDQKITFQEYALEWLENKIKVFKKPSTYKDYERILRVHLNPLIGKVQLSEIKVKHADLVITTLKKNGKSPKGINDILTLLKQVMNEAERREDLLKNHLRHFKGLKTDTQEHKFWTAHEINTFLLAARDHYLYPFFATAIYTGMRKGEIAALTWDCIDFSRNLITVRGTRDKFGHRNSTKTGKFRPVPMNTFLKSVLLELFEKRAQATSYVFVTPTAEPIDTNHLYRIFIKLQKKAGITNQIRVHDLRHTFASQIMMNKGTSDIYVLRDILGHSDVKMTQRYAHLAHDHLAGSTQQLSFGAENELLRGFNPCITPNAEVQKTDESNLRILKA